MKNTSYRNDARLALNRALGHIDSSENANLRYAALELRMALECLIYERAQNYRDELSSKKLSTWQPKQLLSLLLEIDPYADKTSTISVGLEEEYGVQPDVMTELGTDRVISLSEIKDFYDRLGSYLHAPTMEQLEAGKSIPNEKLRSSCEKLIKIIESSLNSKVKNVNFKTTTQYPRDGCGKDIIRRVTTAEAQYQATCIECGGSYTLKKTDNNEYQWSANVQEVACKNPECGEKITLWQKDIDVNRQWICSACNGVNTISLGIIYQPAGLT